MVLCCKPISKYTLFLRPFACSAKVRKVDVVTRDLAMLSDPPGFWRGGWQGCPLFGATEADTAVFFFASDVYFAKVGLVLVPTSLAV